MHKDPIQVWDPEMQEWSCTGSETHPEIIIFFSMKSECSVIKVTGVAKLGRTALCVFSAGLGMQDKKYQLAFATWNWPGATSKAVHRRGSE